MCTLLSIPYMRFSLAFLVKHPKHNRRMPIIICQFEIAAIVSKDTGQISSSFGALMEHYLMSTTKCQQEQFKHQMPHASISSSESPIKRLLLLLFQSLLCQ